mmetsp:Transcript_10271/g.24680  ORF Transcript_10271/g.24680 Transcript_10271/m.24680 type:complete len:427 (+) Transcript_10271:44-1324(+)
MPGSSSVLALPMDRKPKTEFQKHAKKLLDKHCKVDVNDEWQPVDDQKIAKLRGILSALHEENQSTQLLKVESEDREAQLALKATRKSVETRLAFCKEKEMMFKKKQEELRRHVLDNQKSLQDLEAQIEKSEKKALDEQSQSRRLDGEIRALEKELLEKEQQRDTEQGKIGKMAQYRNFLEHVIHESQEEFGDDIEVLMNRHATLEGGSQELTQANDEQSARLDRVRDECTRVQTKLQNEHLAISSQLHKCQVALEQHLAESQELETRLNRALEQKELKESQVGVFTMAIEQLFSRTVNSCRLPQRKKAMLDATDVKFAPVRGDKSDTRLEEMFKQIIERVEDLQEMHSIVQHGTEKPKEEEALFDERGFMDRVKFLYQRGEDDVRRRGTGDENPESLTLGGANSSTLKGRHADPSLSGGHSGSSKS